MSDLERGPDRQEEGTGDQQEAEKGHPPAGFSSLSDGENRVRSQGAGRFRLLVATRCLSASILFTLLPRRRVFLGSLAIPITTWSYRTGAEPYSRSAQKSVFSEIERIVEATERKKRVPMPLLQGLRRVRERRGVSVRQLSAKSGVSADSISDFEELRRMASPRTTRRLAEALGVREEDLR